MYQSSSSSKPHMQKSSPACPADAKMKRKNLQQHHQKQRFRNPFQDLNNVVSDTISNASSMSSVEAPKGCLRFFLSHASNKTHSSNANANHGPSRAKLLSTPKSAPCIRREKENASKRFTFHKPISQKLQKSKKNPPVSRNASSSKISSALNSSGRTENKLKSGSREVEKVVVGVVSDFDGSNSTPLSKVTNGVIKEDEDEKSKINCNSNTTSSSSKTKTPPVQASVSPEIQCGSSMLTTTAKTVTPVCYGAGYVMSGVTDKRKCRPRGILTIGEAKPLSCFDSDDEIEKEGLVDDSVMSALPLPSEASMHWLLSPCNEEDEDKKGDSESELCGFSKFPASSSPGSVVLSPNLCVNNTVKAFSRGFTGPPLYDKTSVLCSEEEKNCSDLAEDTSQFSPASLSSGNVIQTPQSDCSSGRQVGISSFTADIDRKNRNSDSELNTMAERIQMASLSPKNYVSIWDPAGSSFVFDCLSTPSNSVDLSHFQKVLDDRTAWLSNSTMENVSQSQMRISWREGLVSRMFEMDEFDSCRCLSDAEDDANCLESHCSPGLNVDVVNELIPSNDSGSTMDDVKSGHESDRQAKKELTDQVPYSCAESISTDAGSLVRSEDSDWTMCYKNKLFH
ncbi:uncharacterized protein [Euphorbia lathyris]|uniref:uncharacterized protein n=1 Tax=Euphorbia lathyris TaxID=212925 RepID=UPI0033144C60